MPTAGKSKAIANLATLLSESSAFQTWGGFANAAAALAAIYRGGEDWSTLSTRPWVLIGTPEEGGFQQTQIGVATHVGSGTLLIMVAKDIDAGNQATASLANVQRDDDSGDFLQIVRDIQNAEDVAATFRGDYHGVREIEAPIWPGDAESDDVTKAFPYWTQVLEIDWGHAE